MTEAPAAEFVVVFRKRVRSDAAARKAAGNTPPPTLLHQRESTLPAREAWAEKSGAVSPFNAAKLGVAANTNDRNLVEFHRPPCL